MPRATRRNSLSLYVCAKSFGIADSDNKNFVPSERNLWNKKISVLLCSVFFLSKKVSLIAFPNDMCLKLLKLLMISILRSPDTVYKLNKYYKLNSQLKKKH